MELINRIRKSRKGFTLVEIIVVLVILAILAAFTIPAMLGFVNDAKAKSYLAEAREVYTAAQATATEFTAKGDVDDSVLTTQLSSPVVAKITTDTFVTGDTQAIKAAKQMYKYINEDLAIFDGAVPTSVATKAGITSSQSAWTVTVGGGVPVDPDGTGSGVAPAVTTTGKVKSVVYVKGGYVTTVYGDGTDPITVKLK